MSKHQKYGTVQKENEETLEQDELECIFSEFNDVTSSNDTVLDYFAARNVRRYLLIEIQ